MMRCTIWYHLYNLKDVKHTRGGVLLLVKLQAEAIEMDYHIEMDYSENITTKPKFEVQCVYFSGKQYSPHCSIV